MYAPLLEKYNGEVAIGDTIIPLEGSPYSHLVAVIINPGLRASKESEMRGIDLSDTNLESLRHSIAGLVKWPAFSISDDTDVNILFFKRKDRYFGIRTGSIAEFDSPEEFLVYSFLVEEISAHTKRKLVLEQLKVEECSKVELNRIYAMSKKLGEHLPKITDIKHSYIVINNSAINWALLEDETQYHTVFWMESESKLFRRCV